MLRPNLILLVPLLLAFIGSTSAQCPKIAVIGPSGITPPGDVMTFQADVRGSASTFTYRWTVSTGTIESGQGTPEIAVRTDRSMTGGNVTASVDVSGFPADCPSTASEIVPVGGWICGMPVDEWRDLKPNDLRLRLDNVFAHLGLNPTHIGILVMTVTSKEPLNATNKRVQFVLRHAAFRRFDKSRIWFVLEPDDFVGTKYFDMPPGANVPCDKCQILKGSDL